jgi:hypothetical protein
MSRHSRSAAFMWTTALVFSCAAVYGCRSESATDEVRSVQQRLDVSKFQGWSAIPNGFTTLGPAVTATGPDSLIVAVRGSDNTFFTNFWSPFTDWLGWNQVPNGFFTSKPSLTVWGNGHVALVGKGLDDAIWINVTTGSGHMSWSGWQQIPGGPFDTAAAVAFAGGGGPSNDAGGAGNPRALYVLARKSDTNCYWAKNVISGDTYTHANWSTWSAIPNGFLTAEPAAVGTSGNTVNIAVRATDNTFFTNSYDGTSWLGWSRISESTFDSAPAISSRGSGHLDVFGRGFDNNIYVASFDGSWGPFQVVPNGATASPPAAWSWGPGHVDLVVRGFDDRAWRNRFQQ